MNILYLDFETRSRCDLLTKGIYNYAMDASTNVLCMSYAFNDEDVTTWDGDGPLPDRLRNHKGLIYAHNSAFERLICQYVLELDFQLEQFYCTAVQAAANCAPRSLEDIGRFTSSNMRKDHKGKALIKKLCVPRADGTFNNDPDLLKEMIEYCEQDVWTMRAISKMLRPLTAEELADYHVNERINDRGVLLDKPLAEAAVKYAEAEVVEIQQIVREVTNGEITSVRSSKMKEWVRVRVGPTALNFMKVKEDGEERYSLDKTVRANLLALADEDESQVPYDVAEVIQCADDLWSSSVAKFNRLASLADEDDCRVRGAFVFNGGSATGRACVSALSLVETPNGPTPISMLPIGGEVLTHKGRFCKVSRVIYKGRQMMYRVTTHAGGWIECTEEHMLLTNKGWTNVKELISHTQLESARGGDAPVFLTALPYDGRGWAFNPTDARYGVCNRAGDHTAGSTTHPESGELFEIQDGQEEPYVWGAETGRSHTTEGLPVSLAGGQHLCAGAPFSGNGGNGADGVARGVGNTPHRRGQTEQSGGQFGGGDEGGASTFAQTTVKEIVRVGEKGVWDITVEGDASYCAQGLIHHNSSYGAQVHNFPRKSHNDALSVRESIIKGEAVVPKYGKRVTDVLKQMLRPALIPHAGKKLVVADWSSIEARVTPWMTDTPHGEKKLELFASGADVYKHNAAATFGVRPDEVNDHQRQVGKVQELACGFGGGVGAFANMARVYNLTLTETESQRMVDAWRRANVWGPIYWSLLEQAYHRAMRNKGREITAGRVTYLFDGQHLWYALPSGRVLCYPHARFDSDGISYAKAAWKPAQDAKEWPRARLWKGLAVENMVQATANDLLRHALRQIPNVVLHVHDEIVVESDTPEETAEFVKKIMSTPPSWCAGLPLSADVKIMNRYGK